MNDIRCLFLLTFLVCGCVHRPYIQSGDPFAGKEPIDDKPQITRGDPNQTADFLGHYLFSLPEKLLLWNWRAGNHDISLETEKAIEAYIQFNELKDVRVRINEYAPFGEFKRLTHNTSVGAGWRYTLGLVTWVFYTVFPGRIFGGDSYNPFTNSISLYSDLPSVALHELGHARDTAEDEWKGNYVALRLIPLWPLRDENVASSEALSYARYKCDQDLEESMYKTLYPAYGTYVGGSILGDIGGISSPLWILSVIPGHIIGRSKAASFRDSYECGVGDSFGDERVLY